jgi:hypothetical protein
VCVQVTNDLELLPERGQPLLIDLGSNPLSCHEFCVGAFSHWLATTKVTVRNRDSLRCVDATSAPCSELLEASRADGGHSAAALVLGVLLAGLLVTLGVALYLNRTSLTYQLSPLVDNASSRKVRYTSIDKPEEQEMNV